MMKSVLTVIGLLLGAGLGLMFGVAFLGMFLVLLVFALIFGIIVLVFDIPVAVLKKDVKIGTWSRSKGFTPK
jgi:hypothetical protein